MALMKYSGALVAAQQLKSAKLFDTLGRRCLENMELEIGIKAFQQCQNVSMVMMIQSFMTEKEKVLLYAYVAMVLG
jgi:WD repeat-containing protein 19